MLTIVTDSWLLSFSTRNFDINSEMCLMTYTHHFLFVEITSDESRMLSRNYCYLVSFENNAKKAIIFVNINNLCKYITTRLRWFFFVSVYYRITSLKQLWNFCISTDNNEINENGKGLLTCWICLSFFVFQSPVKQAFNILFLFYVFVTIFPSSWCL